MTGAVDYEGVKLELRCSNRNQVKGIVASLPVLPAGFAWVVNPRILTGGTWCYIEAKKITRPAQYKLFTGEER